MTRLHVCSKCGKQTARLYPGDTCQGCYRYFHGGGTENPLPRAGEIAYDARGFVVCHICGRAYRRLGSHLRESHGLTIAEYKESFGLCARSRTTESDYSHRMRNKAYLYGMPERLIETGKATRVKKGENKLRLGKKKPDCKKP